MNYDFYVRADGTNTGDGSKESPFGCLEFAKKKLAETFSGLKGEVSVWLEDGRYYLREPLVFTPSDGGNDDLKVTYCAVNKGKAVLCCGQRVTGWTKADEKLYKAKLDARHVRNFYVNGVRGILAREPNGERFHKIDGWNEDGTRVCVKNRLLKGASSFEAVEYLEWSECIVRIKGKKATDEKGEYVLLEPRENEEKYFRFHRFHPVQKREDMLIRFQNAKEFLDSPGEFFFDETEKTLYYYPRPEENMESANAIVPVADGCIELSGERNDRVKNLRFENFAIEYTAFSAVGELGFMELQAGHYCNGYLGEEQLFDIPRGAVHVRNAENVGFFGLTIEHCGGSGINFYYGVRESEIHACQILDTSAAGIVLAPFITGTIQDDNLYLPKSEAITVHDIRITDNYIGYFGQEFTRSPGLLNVLGYQILMEHNEIAFGNYTGLSNGWGWSKNDYVVCKNTIRLNDIHHIGIKGSDLGGIYNLNNQRDTKIVENYIHEINKGRNGFSEGSPAEGIYLDEGSNHLTVSDNQIAYAGEIGRLIYTNVAGEENVIENNRGKMCGDILDKDIVARCGIRVASVAPYASERRGICEGLRLGTFRKGEGKFGFKFEPARDLTATALGAFRIYGNIGKHSVALYDDGLNPLIETTIDFLRQNPAKNGFVYAEIPHTGLKKNKKYFLLIEEYADGDEFCGSDSLQYFNEDVRYHCGVSISENIRKEICTYVGLDIIVEK